MGSADQPVGPPRLCECLCDAGAVQLEETVRKHLLRAQVDRQLRNGVSKKQLRESCGEAIEEFGARREEPIEDVTDIAGGRILDALNTFSRDLEAPLQSIDELQHVHRERVGTSRGRAP